RVGPHRGGAGYAGSGLAHVAIRGVETISPGPAASVGTPRRLLPLLLGRHPHRPTLPHRAPARIGFGVREAHAHHRPRRVPAGRQRPSALGPLRPVATALAEET